MEPAARSHDVAQASERVLEGAVALAKAETRLAVIELSAKLARATMAAAILGVAGLATSMAMMLLCVSPLLVASWDARRVLLSMALSACIGGVLGTVGVRRMRAAFAQAKTGPKEE